MEVAMKQVGLKRACLIAAAAVLGLCGSVSWSQNTGLHSLQVTRKPGSAGR